MLELKLPFMVDFELTNRCPYKCVFCEADIPNNSMNDEMSTTECFQVFDKLSQAGVLGVFLTGGEPFVRDDLPDIIKYCFSVGLEPTVSTSSFGVSDEMIDLVIGAGLTHLQISIHGYGDVHNSVVKTHGAYDKVLEGLENILKKNIDIEIACIGLKENFESIPQLLSDLVSLGVRKFRILRDMTAHSKEMLDQIPPRKMVIDTMTKITAIAQEHNVDLLPSFCPGLVSDPRTIYAGTHPMALTCPAGKTEFAILPNGDVYPCINFKNNPAMYAGNILKDDLFALWNHPKMKQLRQLTPMDYTGTCGECEKKNVCYSARCVALNLTGDLYGDDLSCYLVREKLGYDV